MVNPHAKILSSLKGGRVQPVLSPGRGGARAARFKIIMGNTGLVMKKENGGSSTSVLSNANPNGTSVKMKPNSIHLQEEM